MPFHAYMTKLDFDDAELDRRRRYFEITDEDLKLLASLRGFAETASHEIVEDLYQLILGHEESRKFFQDDATLNHVKRMQREYFLGLFTDRLDLAYVADRLRVGYAHQRIGMPPRLYIGAYGRFLRAIHARLAREISDPVTVWKSYVSIEKRVRFDESLAIQTYIAVHLDDLREATTRAQESRAKAEAAQVRAEESERELRAVAEFREMFIGILGHDLKNPLAAIRMAAGLLQRSDHCGPQDKMATALIGNSARRMTRMINQLLDLTRARLGGGLPLELKHTDLREVCQSIVAEFEAHIRLEVEGDVTGTWDADRLAEVLSNIAGNAIEHADPGTAVVVGARADGEGVVVEVSNRGNPIPPDVLPFIFEPFRRARQLEKSATGNLGLGLFIAQQIVLSHGGRLDAHSADGTTTFVIRLPRRLPRDQLG